MVESTGSRAYPVGPAIVEPYEERWGHDDSAYSPSEYLDYIATSNNVYTCVTKRANAMSALPIKVYKGKKKDSRKEVETGSLRNLLDSVNPWMTWDRLINLTEQYLCLSGEAFWFLERGRRGDQMPQEIWPVRPDMVRIVPDPVNFIRGFLLYPQTGGEPIAYTPDEVIWFPYPNPKDPYSGLAPLAAARLAADTASAAMKSNYGIFSNGTRLGGVISPPDNTSNITDAQAKELQLLFNKKLRGPDKTHALAVLAYAVKFQEWTMTPKDAEFLGALDLTLEEIARAFGIAPDLLGGSKRTYQNAPEARYAFWADTIMSEARFIQNVITERLVPMFGDEADSVEFDFSDVDAMRENEDAKWKREMEQINTGVLLRNEWRADKGMPDVEWGDVWWTSSTMTPISSGAIDLPESTQAPPALTEQDGVIVPEPRHHVRAVYGSDDHAALWKRYIRRIDPLERKFGEMCADLMRRQKRAVLAKLRQRSALSVREAAAVSDDPFDLARWNKTFRETSRPTYLSIVETVGQAALDDVKVSAAFDVLDPNVVRFIERSSQRFAREVNQTTWDKLRATLQEGVKSGESIDDLAARVEATMGERIRSSAETIARTETIAASTGGTLESWRQSGVVGGKEWNATLDERCRASHVEAHGQRVALDANFEVGGATGPGPGQMSDPSESVNCRCVVVPILDIDWEG